MDLDTICYVLHSDALVYINVYSGEKTESAQLPVTLYPYTFFIIHNNFVRRIRDETTIFEHPHVIVEDFECKDLVKLEHWKLAAECLKCFGYIPPEQTVKSVEFADVFQSPLAEDNSCVLRHLQGKNVSIPVPHFPSLIYLTDEHVVCKTSDLYQTFAKIVSRGRYDGKTPNLLKKWILSSQGNQKIPFPPYFITTLIALGLPESGIFSIVDESTFVLTREGLKWVNERAENAFDDTVSYVGVNAAILRLGHWNALPSVIITEVKCYHKSLSFDAPTKFIHDFIWKAVRGGNWVKTAETQNLSKEKDVTATAFYSRLFTCMWENRFFIYNDEEIDSCTGEVIDSRPHYLKLYDYVAKDNGCITFSEVDTNTGHNRYVDVPWATCCVYMPPRKAIEDAALYQLEQFLQRPCKRKSTKS